MVNDAFRARELPPRGVKAMPARQANFGLAVRGGLLRRKSAASGVQQSGRSWPSIVRGPGGILYITTADISHWRVPKDVRTWDAYKSAVALRLLQPEKLRAVVRDARLRPGRRRLAFKPGIKAIFKRN
jgi:hypothetical protein